ncbi:MAG: sigma-70 family RNA polymerase sigma factor [Candidatus Hydrogenedentes bacterium]|nr:sigma-70 family RNA polymerase sigma factor [Candidatus Hydrogenedentota bacterium]
MVLLREARTHTDTGLVERCRKGDSSAFDELVRRYKDRVYCVAYRYLGNREDALDVSQEVFVRAYRGIGSFRGTAQVCTWLHSITANLARNRLRDGSRMGRDKGTSLEAMRENSPGLADAGDGHASPREAAIAEETQEMLLKCLGELPEQYRLAFVLRTFDDLSYEEIAEVMECPVGTVKSRLNQARQLLRDQLREHAVI